MRRRQWHPTPVLLPGKSMDGGAWKAAVHGVARSRTQLSDFTFTFHFHALEKEMATHSSVLAWRIPGAGEPGGLPSMGSHRVGQTFVGKVMSQLFNMLSKLVTAFLPRSKHLLISWLQSPSAVILEPPKIKSNTVSTVSPSISHEVMGPDAMILVFRMLFRCSYIRCKNIMSVI